MKIPESVDLLIGTFAGGLTASAAILIIPPDWQPISGMIAGGLLGLALKFILLLMLAPFFGAFEVMIPSGIINMLVGMGAGMAITRDIASPFFLIISGALVGLIIAKIILIMNKRLTEAK